MARVEIAYSSKKSLETDYSLFFLEKIIRFLSLDFLCAFSVLEKVICLNLTTFSLQNVKSPVTWPYLTGGEAIFCCNKFSLDL